MVTGKCSVLAALAALVLGVAGCGSGGGTAPPSGTSASAAMPMDTTGTATSTGASATTAPSGASTTSSAITIKNFAYGPTLEVPAGSTVMVTNTDSAAHTVTADQGGAFDVTVKGSGGTATFTAPATPGTYTYHCTYHPNMHGTLVVK